MSINEFTQRFVFRPEMTGYAGVERERFINDREGNIIPRAEALLSALEPLKTRPGQFGYELSACQIESRDGACPVERIGDSMRETDAILAAVSYAMGIGLSSKSVGPWDMPLDVYPDPTGRYQHIVKDMPLETLRSACRIIGTHVHIGMPDHATAVRVYNKLLPHCHRLCNMGDNSSGERLAIYREMVPNWDPKPCRNWEDYYEASCTWGFINDPRKCWWLIRISVHGTIEFRMFSATDSVWKVTDWVRECHRLCMMFLTSEQ